MMSAKLRGVKNESVHENLKRLQIFRSNQGAVWDEIEYQARANKVQASTGAMRDILEAKKEDMDSYLEHFPLVPDQSGLLVIMNSEVVGMDMISGKQAFAQLHPKLIKSYVMDSLTVKPKKGISITGQRPMLFSATSSTARRVFLIPWDMDRTTAMKGITWSARRWFTQAS